MLVGVARAFVAAALALPAAPVPAGALGTRAEVQRLESEVQRLSDQHSRQERSLAALRTEIDEKSRELDTLLATQERLQRHLNSRAGGMYRTGRLSFVEVLTGSASFTEFSSRWDLLTRMNRRDADVLVQLKATKRKAIATARELIAKQERASAQLRALGRERDAAGRDLASSRNALRAQRASRAGAPAPAVGPAAARRGAPTPRGSGAWQSAVASHYGPGSYGHRTADGTVVRPDSMIVAHKTLPFGTLVEFEYAGRTAVARVADRGPYVAGRTWDLGPGVVRVLGFNGVHSVRYRIIGR